MPVESSLGMVGQQPSELRCTALKSYCRSCSVHTGRDNKPYSCYGRRNESWRLRKLRLMFTIPVILLPLAVLLTLIYALNMKVHQVDHMRMAQLTDRPNRTARAVRARHPELVNPETFQFEEESSEAEMRDVLQDVETRFLPPPVSYAHVAEKYLDKERNKRNTEEMLRLFQDYEGNVTSSEEIVWTISQLPASRDQSQEVSSEMEEDNITEPRMNNMKPENSSISSEEHAEEDDLEGIQTSDEIDVEETGNSLNRVFNNDGDTDESYLETNLDQDEFPSDDTSLNYPLDKNEDNGSSQLNEDLIDTSKIDLDKDSDFYMFWRGQGDKASIRKAQARLMSRIMDKTADPCHDFYQYACGNWDVQNPIPKDKGGNDMFEKLQESLDKVLKGLLDVPIDQDVYRQDPNNAQIKAKILYQSCMDFKRLAGRGSEPLKEFLANLGGWPIIDPSWNSSNFDWLFVTAQLRLYNNDILIAEWVAPDIKNSDEYVIQIDQSSLGLPTRDYFLNPKNERFVYAYKKYIYKVAQLMGAPYDTLEGDVEGIITFETDLAKITIAAEARRNVSEIYRRTSLGELQILVPEIDWRRYLTIVLNREVALEEPLVIFTTKFFTDLVDLIGLTPRRHIANYLLWRFVRHRVNNLDDSFLAAKQEFYMTLFGREQAPQRWKNCIAQVNANMGMALGAMFVEKYFDENSKNDTLQMTTDIMQSFRQLLQRNSWIDSRTKALANQKVDAMKLRIGYPDYIMHQADLNERFIDVKIEPDEYFENTLKILQHLAKSEQGRLGQPVNKTVWNTAPAIVNAYYSRNKNQIMFPAGILQPPFYHRYFPRSLNYGGIGVVIGHEVTHGFDDKGRLFDQFGNLHRWWMEQSILNFHERAQCLIDQYSTFHVKEVNMMVDGENTQGENIADNGGVKQAFLAYKRWLKRNDMSDETLPNVNATHEQLFFLNFAQIWCGSNRPESLRGKLETAVHSPGRYRVIGTLSNSKDFARVFNCPKGTPMNPTKKCSVW